MIMIAISSRLLLGKTVQTNLQNNNINIPVALFLKNLACERCFLCVSVQSNFKQDLIFCPCTHLSRLSQWLAILGQKYICILNNRRKKPLCDQIKPAFWT